MPKYIFIDTNIFLHFKPIEELKLPEQYGKDCVLVIPRVILGELDKHKDSNKSSKIQNRARSICKKIHSWNDSGKITDDLKFKFVIATSDPKKHGLNPDSADDRFLSDILLYDAPLEDKILIAYDTNMILTAKHFGICTQEIDESLKLPSEPDPEEKEKQELQRKLNRLENALPKLEVGLVSSESDEDVEPNPIFKLKARQCLSDEDIEVKVSGLKLSEYKENKDSIVSKAGLIHRGEIERYNEEIREYPNLYRQYLLKLREYHKRCGILINVAIINKGTAPAENVDISLHFPDGFQMYLEDNLPTPPREPALPDKPFSFTSKIPSICNLSNLNPRIPNIDFPKSFYLKKTNSYEFKDRFKFIKHNEKVLMPKLYLYFKNHEEVKSFQCTYRITVANLPDPIDGVINFKFIKGSTSCNSGGKDE